MARLHAVGGDGIRSGNLSNPESSATLAVNCFGWFIERLGLIPVLPGLQAFGRADMVDIEFSARFPRAGGLYPWLDAEVQTEKYLVGIDSKGFEPFRDRTKRAFSESCNREVWGPNMVRYESLRDALRSNTIQFRHLGAVQLVKHAFGLMTEGGRRKHKPILLYLSAVPVERRDKNIGSRSR